ncbi:enoyl-CoA hydratase-related protein [Gordonia sp. HY285]|uniref:enoyl-CoA hydratase/isomerase family protein n=1 Tax=Gordonia liuliyuniae TaxID=2911517 RepID=UPI001F0303F3|nr:enoyl-CoA hydratase-related protein [Gordonia liuliyuniae]MCF8610535.1 enoyl-CoA hydratase-related protein [Gordonia liuliyuniae]
MTDYETVTVDATDGVATVTLNRPDVRNAINAQVQTDLAAVLDQIRGDDTIGGVVFTGAGDKAFAAGGTQRLAQSLQYTTADKAEGAAAFLGKRAPEWTGR